MLLERLSEYAGRLDLAPPMYIKTPIRWLIDLDSAGKLLGFVQTEGTGKRNDPGKEFYAPFAGKTSGVRATPLFGNAEYVLGIPRLKGDRAKVEKRHHAFADATCANVRETGEPAVGAIVRFLDSLDAAMLVLPDGFQAMQNITFRVEAAERLPIHLPSVQDYWASQAAAALEKDSRTLECLVCGNRRSIPSRLEFFIRGWSPKCQSKMTIISANKDAFESYGLERSHIAPPCHSCSERFVKAVNAMLADDAAHITLGTGIPVLDEEAWPSPPRGSCPTRKRRRCEASSSPPSAARQPPHEWMARLSTRQLCAERLAPSAYFLETTVGVAKRNILSLVSAPVSRRRIWRGGCSPDPVARVLGREQEPLD